MTGYRIKPTALISEKIKPTYKTVPIVITLSIGNEAKVLNGDEATLSNILRTYLEILETNGVSNAAAGRMLEVNVSTVIRLRRRFGMKIQEAKGKNK